MATMDETIAPDELDSVPRKRKRRWAKRLGWALAAVLAPLLLAGIFLSTPIGKRFVADQIADAAGHQAIGGTVAPGGAVQEALGAADG